MYEGIKDIYELLDKRRLKEALTQLQALGTEANPWNLKGRIEETATAYGYMLQYAARGMADPTRTDFYHKTLCTAYELTDELDTALQAKKGTGTYYDCIRTLALKPARTYADLTLALETYGEDMMTVQLLYNGEHKRKKETARMAQSHEDAVNELFERTWAAPHWSETEAQQATDMLNSILIPATDIAVLVSAATLAQLRMFDARKLNFLCEAYRHPDPLVNQRAIVGIVLILLKHAARIGIYPNTAARINLLIEEDAFYNNLMAIQMQLLISRETEKIDKRMREDIIPGIIKNAKHLKNTSLRLDEADEADGLNPEWESWTDKNGLEDKIREMSEWQMAGADVYMSSFSQLKHYPFFHRLSNWFRPFDTRHPELEPIQKELEEDTSITPLRLIAHSPYFCNSDKYSFALSISSMPAKFREMSFRQMEQQVEAEEGSLDKMRNMIEMTPNPKDVSRQYLQDLYRFFKLWRGRYEEEDIFHWNFRLWENSWLKTRMTADTEGLKQIGDYLLQKEHYLEAINVHLKLVKKEPSPEIMQKIGYSAQAQKIYTDAIFFYKQADILQPDNLWTLKHLAYCERMNGEYQKSLDDYRRAEKIAPDDLGIAKQIALCLIHLEQYDEALSYLYKMEYLGKNPEKARRAIGWCQFCAQRYDEAMKYLEPIALSENAEPQDWMNMGHLLYATGSPDMAMHYYRMAYTKENNHATFIDQMNSDRDALNKNGMTDEDIAIITDLLV